MDNNIIKDALQPIKYTNANGEIKELNPQQLLTFDANQLVTGVPFQSTANVYYLVARLAERKKLEAKDLDTQLDALRSSLYIQYVQDKNLIQLNNGRKPPESMLNTAIQGDTSFIALSKKRNEVDYQSRCLSWLVKALEMKANMMQSLSANQRKQMEMTQIGKN